MRLRFLPLRSLPYSAIKTGPGDLGQPSLFPMGSSSVMPLPSAQIRSRASPLDYALRLPCLLVAHRRPPRLVPPSPGRAPLRTRSAAGSGGCLAGVRSCCQAAAPMAVESSGKPPDG
jgi:hypothetical protein